MEQIGSLCFSRYGGRRSHYEIAFSCVRRFGCVLDKRLGRRKCFSLASRKTGGSASGAIGRRQRHVAGGGTGLDRHRYSACDDQQRRLAAVENQPQLIGLDVYDGDE